MIKKILLKSGYCISGKKSKICDILIENEKIKKVEKNIIADKGIEVIDCKGKYIFPGFIDGHTHFMSLIGGTLTADDFYSGTKAALVGGTTTIIDYGAGAKKSQSLIDYFNIEKKKAENNCCCDYSFHITISSFDDNIKNEIKKIIDLGITSFKIYTTYDSKLNDYEIYEAMSEISKYKGLVAVHCENDDIISNLRARVKNNDKNKIKMHYITRPDVAEEIEAYKIAGIANITKCLFLCVHITNRKTIEILTKLRKFGYKIFTETCPQYLLFDDKVYNKDFDISCRYICSPPLRKKNDIKSLWNNIKNKNIDMVSTDHCSFTFEQKKIGIDDFTKIPSGLNCIEQRALVMFDAVFHKKISKEVMCKVLCENQAKIFGLYDRKGFLKQGYDADIVILNPNETTVFSSKTQMTKSDYCLFEKKRMKGKIEKVFLRGSLVVDNGVIIKERVGEFVKRKKCLV